MGKTSEMHIQMQQELQQTIEDAREGNILLLDAFIELEENRKQLESNIELIKAFKSEFTNDIAEASQEYKDGYKGYVVECRNGAKRYSYKNVPEWTEADGIRKNIESMYKAAFEGVQKGNTITDGDGNWIDANGEPKPLPEISYNKSTVILKAKK